MSLRASLLQKASSHASRKHHLLGKRPARGKKEGTNLTRNPLTAVGRSLQGSVRQAMGCPFRRCGVDFFYSHQPTNPGKDAVRPLPAVGGHLIFVVLSRSLLSKFGSDGRLAACEVLDLASQRASLVWVPRRKASREKKKCACRRGCEIGPAQGYGYFNSSSASRRFPRGHNLRCLPFLQREPV